MIDQQHAKTASGTVVPFLASCDFELEAARAPKPRRAQFAEYVGRNEIARAIATEFIDETHRAAPPNPGQAGYVETVPPHETYLDRQAAAKYLHVQPNTLAAWACSKRVKLAYSKLGRRVVYRKVDLDAFVAANMEGGV